MTKITKPYWAEARRYIDAETGDADQPIMFQVFDDAGNDDDKAAFRFGRLSNPRIQKWLIQKALQGCGIFATVNETDGTGRRRANMKTVRMAFADLDGEPLPGRFPLQPHVIVESSPGRYHVGFFVKPTTDFNAWSDVQARLAAYYNGDPKMIDPPRVLRLPGFDHQKKKPFRSRIVKLTDEFDLDRYTLERIADAHPCEYKKPRERQEGGRSAEPESGWDNEEDLDTARVYLTDVDPPAEGNRNNEGYNVACYLNDLAISPEKSLELMAEHWNPRLDAPLEDHELRHVINSAGQYKESDTGSKSDAVKVAEAQAEFEEIDSPVDAADKSTKSKHHNVGGVSYQIGSDVESEVINWIWPNRYPSGKVSILAGFPDFGKSQITLNIAATITTGGKWPNDEGKAEQGAVIILSSEDTAADTLRPRLLAAGADMDQVIIVSATVKVVDQGKKRRRTFNIEDDLKNLKGIIRIEAEKGRHVRAVILDPLNAYFGGGKKGDAHKNADMRALLTPLTEWAGTHRIGIIGIMHFNKGGNAHTLYRVTDSGAITASARAVWFAIKDGNTGTLMMLNGKHNLSKDVGGLCYSFDDKDIGEKGIVAPYIVWGDATHTTAEEALASAGPVKITEAERATNILVGLLAAGPMLASEATREVVEKHGISEATLRRARRELGVKITGGGKNYTWSLPEAFVPDDEFETPSAA